MYNPYSKKSISLIITKNSSNTKAKIGKVKFRDITKFLSPIFVSVSIGLAVNPH